MGAFFVGLVLLWYADDFLGVLKRIADALEKRK